MCRPQFQRTMASRNHQAGYSKYYGRRLSNLTAESTDDDVKRVYDSWARDYDKVRQKILFETIPENKLHSLSRNQQLRPGKGNSHMIGQRCSSKNLDLNPKGDCFAGNELFLTS